VNPHECPEFAGEVPCETVWNASSNCTLIHCTLAVLHLLEIRDCLVLISDNALSAQPFVKRQNIFYRESNKSAEMGRQEVVAFRCIFAHAKCNPNQDNCVYQRGSVAHSRINDRDLELSNKTKPYSNTYFDGISTETDSAVNYTAVLPAFETPYHVQFQQPNNLVYCWPLENRAHFKSHVRFCLFRRKLELDTF
jgi:hypothetical protein